MWAEQQMKNTAIKLSSKHIFIILIQQQPWADEH